MAFRVAVCKINQKLDPAKGKFTVEKYDSSAETVGEKRGGKAKTPTCNDILVLLDVGLIGIASRIEATAVLQPRVAWHLARYVCPATSTYGSRQSTNDCHDRARLIIVI